jgi:CheY-like chemotaxis protein
MMHVREPRIVVECPIEFTRLDQRVKAVTEDVSRHGAYVRTEQYLLRGDVVDVAISLPSGSIARATARVAHVMPASAARALGRTPGMGLEFLGLPAAELVDELGALSKDAAPVAEVAPVSATVLLLDAEAVMADRLSRHLGPMGLTFHHVTAAAEAYAECLRARPDVLLADIALEGMDVWSLLRMLAAHPHVSTVPVMLMSDDASDMTRLKAYRLGVRDFINKPFTDEEIGIRLGRLASPRRTSAERVALRGNLEEIGMPMLLSLLEFERKSGVLVILRGTDAARLFVASGQIVRVESSLGEDSRRNVMAVLGWTDGSFEFIAGEVVGRDEIGVPTSHLLLEHARVSDEDARDDAESRLDAL